MPLSEWAILGLSLMFVGTSMYAWGKLEMYERAEQERHAASLRREFREFRPLLTSQEIVDRTTKKGRTP
ncbi:MAG: hypothetical protein WAJ96_07765 [Candidatus Acidiferrum sp.]